MPSTKEPKRAAAKKPGQKKQKKSRSVSAERAAAIKAKRDLRAAERKAKKAQARAAKKARAAERKAKAKAREREKKAIVTTQTVKFPANFPIIPCTDSLVGREITARVNCKPHVSKRTGKTSTRCDKQRVVVVGCATPSVERPRTTQLFAVQKGQRFNIPDATIRRDLRRSERERASRSVAPAAPANEMTFAPGSAFAGMTYVPCETVAERVAAGLPVPQESYDACPAVAEMAGGDPSFDPKGNSAASARVVVARDVPASMVFDRATTAGAFVVNGRQHDSRELYSYVEVYDESRAPVAWGHAIVSPDGYVWINSNPEANFDHYGSQSGHGTVYRIKKWLDREGGQLMVRGLARKANHHGGHHAPGDPLGVYLPPPSEWKEARVEGRPSAIVWVHPSLRWQFWLYRDGSGAVVIPRDHARNRTFTPANGDVYAQMKHWYASQHFGFTKPNRAPARRIPGATLLPREGDPLMGLRVAGDGYSGEVRAPAIPYDGRGTSHIVGGHVLSRARVAGAVRRDEKRLREEAFRSRYGVFAPPPPPVPFGQRFGAGYAEDLRPRLALPAPEPLALPAPAASEAELAQAFVAGLGGEVAPPAAAPRAARAPRTPKAAAAPRAAKAPRTPRAVAAEVVSMASPAPMPSAPGAVSNDEVMAMFSQYLGDLAPKPNRYPAGRRW